MAGRHPVHRFIIAFFFIDFLLCFSYAVNYLIGQPSAQITRLLRLDGEMNLPAWYSSMKWFFAAALFGTFSFRNFDRHHADSWVLLLIPLFFVVFSIDEVSCIHEWLGTKSDALLPTGDRADTFFKRTGIWNFVVGIPVLLICFYALVSMKRYFSRSPRAFRKTFLGISVFFAGALGMEILSNLPETRDLGHILQNVLEEGMEMAGVTILIWAAWDLLLAHGFSWHLDPADASRCPAGENYSLFTEEQLAIRKETTR